MDIKAKAKPVRFRIVSGGVECTSLDDLRAHFDLKSVADTINDGRLEKWLNYIKEFDFAKQVKEIGKFDPFDMEMSLRVLSLFTGVEYGRENFNSDIEYIEFLDNDKNTSGFALNLIKESMRKDVDVLLYAYHNHAELITDVHECFESLLNTPTDWPQSTLEKYPEVLWCYGKELADSGNISDKKKGKSFIEKAAKMGVDEAVSYKKNHQEASGALFVSESRKSMVSEIIREVLGIERTFWVARFNISRMFNVYAKNMSYSQAERDLFEICRICDSLKEKPTWKLKRQKLELGCKLCNKNCYRHILDFLIIYLSEKEGWDGSDGAIAKYKHLSFMPAQERAKDLSRKSAKCYITTRTNKKIQMPLCPSLSEINFFIYDLLFNILDFYDYDK